MSKRGREGPAAPQWVSVRVASLSPAARAAILEAENRSKVARLAIEEWVARRSEREALARIEAGIAELRQLLSRLRVGSPGETVNPGEKRQADAENHVTDRRERHAAGILRWLNRQEADEGDS